MRNYSSKLWAQIWGILVLGVLLSFLALVPSSRINSNLFDLLPQGSNATYNNELLDQYLVTLDKQLIWLISADDGEFAAQKWVSSLEKIPEIENIAGKKDDESLQAWTTTLRQYPALLPQSFFEKIQDERYLPWVQSQIFSPFSGLSVAEITHDPFLTTRSFVIEQLKSNQQFSMKNGWITVTDSEGLEWFLIRAELTDNASGMLSRKKIVNEISFAKTALVESFPDLQVLQKGALYYGNYAAKTAERDISTIGVVSILGILIIFYLFFRSWRAISLTLSALSIGILFGTTTVLLIYREIHLITIVMSTSIIGVAIDYTLFFLTARSIEGDTKTAKETLQKTLKPLLGALLSTCIAYAVLIFAPFVGLEQLAIFTITGLLAVFFTVIAWFPIMAKLPVRKHKIFSESIIKYLSFWNKKPKTIISLSALIAFITLVGFVNISTDDDIGKLQDLPQNLVAEDQKISQILNQHATHQVLMITGETPDQLIDNLEEIGPLLESLQAGNIIESYRKLPYASLAKQESNLALLDGISEKLDQLYLDSGFEKMDLSLSTERMPLTQWLNSPLSEGLNLLFQILPSDESAFIIPITKINNISALKEAIKPMPYLHWVDQKSTLSELFETYRITMQWLLAVSLLLVSALFLLFKGINIGLRMLFPIIMAISTPIAIFGLLGSPLNLFTIMALILVVGMSIDYVLFFASKNQTTISFMTITLAALISELTFGLLATSNTNAIASFGLVLATGIATALLFSPFAKADIFTQRKDQ